MNKKLQRIRKEIDVLDIEIMQLIRARKSFAKDLVFCKYSNKILLRDLDKRTNQNVHFLLLSIFYQIPKSLYICPQVVSQS